MVKRRFEPGDVIQYHCPGHIASSGIVSRHDEHGVWVSAFNHNVGDGWALTGIRPALITADPNPIPHPDADRVLANYIAWRLTQ